MSKIYQKTLLGISLRKIPVYKGSLGDYRLAIRDKTHWKDVYILSNQNPKFEEIEDKLRVVELNQLSVKIQFVKKFGKKFINNLL